MEKEREKIYSSSKAGIMEKIIKILFLAALLLPAACRDKKIACCPNDTKSSSRKTCPMQSGAPSAVSNSFSGVVVEAMNATDYTYVLIDTGGAKVWAVGPQFAVKQGDTVIVGGAMPMANFKSKTLNRTFELVFFSGSIAHKGEQSINEVSMPPNMADASSPHDMGSHPDPAGKTDFSGIKKPFNGKTVAELFRQKDNLAGKNVTLCAKVVKATYGVMGMTWLHLRDGTGGEGNNDLTAITTDTNIKVDQIVTVEGTLTKGKNIGYGHNFPLVLEHAKIGSKE